jgi:hypothetical protein
MPTDAQALEQLEDAGDLAGAEESTDGFESAYPRGGTAVRPGWDRTEPRGRDLSDALGRLGEEYTRSFALEPEAPAEPEPDPAPSEAAPVDGLTPRDEPRVVPRPAPKPVPREPPSPSTEARDRYGL